LLRRRRGAGDDVVILGDDVVLLVALLPCAASLNWHFGRFVAKRLERSWKKESQRFHCDPGNCRPGKL
jgi:hypothetical protein